MDTAVGHQPEEMDGLTVRFGVLESALDGRILGYGIGGHLTVDTRKVLVDNAPRANV